MTPVGSIEGRQPYETMNAFFRPQIPVCISSIDGDRSTFNSRFFTLGHVEDIGLVTFAFCPAQVHPFEHFSPILRVGPASSGVDCQECIPRIVLTRKLGLECTFVDLFFELYSLGFNFWNQVWIFKLG